MAESGGADGRPSCGPPLPHRPAGSDGPAAADPPQRRPPFREGYLIALAAHRARGQRPARPRKVDREVCRRVAGHRNPFPVRGGSRRLQQRSRRAVANLVSLSRRIRLAAACTVCIACAPYACAKHARDRHERRKSVRRRSVQSKLRSPERRRSPAVHRDRSGVSSWFVPTEIDGA